jgi:hypothetical protein
MHTLETEDRAPDLFFFFYCRLHTADHLCWLWPVILGECDPSLFFFNGGRPVSDGEGPFLTRLGLFLVCAAGVRT